MEWTPVKRLCLHFNASGPAPLTASVSAQQRMKPVRRFRRTLPDRVVALVLLIACTPTLLLVWLVLRGNSDEPVLQREERKTARGGNVMSYRFRTTGRGSRAFQRIGRFVRRYSIDEFPALWSIVAGDLRLKDILRLFKVV